MILFLKAVSGQAVLFPGLVQVKGHARGAAFVRPHQARRQLRADDPRQVRLDDVAQDEETGEWGLRCLFCGQPEHLALHEVWGDHNFQLETCCPDLHEAVVRDMADDPDYATELLRELGTEDVVGQELRRVAYTDDGFGDVLLDYHPEVRPISRREANQFIDQWHRHNGPLPADVFRAGVWNGPTLLGIVMVGAPTARAYMPAFQARDMIEVRRLAIRTDLPRELTWKAASTLYRYAADEAERRGFGRIITYTLADEESGMSLRYARWKPEERVRGKSWNTPARPRQDKAPVVDKQRWVKRLAPVPEAQAA